MSKFRKKSIVVDAIRNDGTWKPIIDWLQEAAGDGLIFQPGQSPPITRNDDGSLNIATREGTMRAEVGDWVIREPFSTGDRCLYPCKPDIFEATYEPEPTGGQS